jgi:signal peptidase I
MESQESQSQGPHPLDMGMRRSRRRAVAVWTRDILVSLAVAFFVITFLYQPVRVEGTSMLPRLQDQDRIFINKFVYHFEDISRGDVVVFYYPRDPSKSYIKRVIALPRYLLSFCRRTVIT